MTDLNQMVACPEGRRHIWVQIQAETRLDYGRLVLNPSL